MGFIRLEILGQMEINPSFLLATSSFIFLSAVFYNVAQIPFIGGEIPSLSCFLIWLKECHSLS